MYTSACVSVNHIYIQVRGLDHGISRTYTAELKPFSKSTKICLQWLRMVDLTTTNGVELVRPNLRESPRFIKI